MSPVCLSALWNAKASLKNTLFFRIFEDFFYHAFWGFFLPCFGVRADPSRNITLNSSPEAAPPSFVLDEGVSHVPHIIFSPICECWQDSSSAELGLALFLCVCTITRCVFKGTRGQSNHKNEFEQLCKSLLLACSICATWMYCNSSRFVLRAGLYLSLA